MVNPPGIQFLAPDAPYCEPDKAKVIIIPAPLEYSVCYMKGTARGPEAILEASGQMELYDEELDCCPTDIGVHTRAPLDYSGMDHAAALKATGDAVREVLQRGQFPFTLGGEHSLSAPVIQAVHEHYPDLTVVHIDAHGDLRDTYEGTPLSHACIERRVVDMGIPLLEIGIRSFSPEEVAFMKTRPNVSIVWAYEIARGTAQIPWERLGKHTYITLDLDAFDPAAMPAVGTPEPGGLSWYQVLDLVREVCRRSTVVGMDVVELCPMPNQAHAEFLAARLVHKMLGYRFFAKQ
ncbi:agmatinase [Thermosporothrix hazakensis]|jgi:agmatinase|uniref:Agmatinase n=2 Tax=Thermosporothrix TaxID=768650 RepID=A0A326U6Q1_THEHA|nr:agmatinase [Thermosporothrix hazakensis]PZW30483.1 agmatinase [Thermosporothrix hazakensis]BBH91197.1 agmatinase [Thermosporothrix sp. COM3]GCE49343.1 agmatinase [Thermosporothrix hazakensis]